MHTILAVLEAEIDIPSSQGDTCFMLILIEGVDYVAVIDGLEVGTLDYATPLPAVKDTGCQREVVHVDLAVALIGEYDTVILRELQDTDHAFQSFAVEVIRLVALLIVNHHQMVGVVSGHEGIELIELLRADGEDVGNGMKHREVFIQPFVTAMGKLHETEQQQQLLLCDECGFELLAYVQYDHLFVDREIRIIVDGLCLIKQIQVFLVRAYAEMAGQIRGQCGSRFLMRNLR